MSPNLTILISQNAKLLINYKFGLNIYSNILMFLDRLGGSQGRWVRIWSQLF